MQFDSKNRPISYRWLGAFSLLAVGIIAMLAYVAARGMLADAAPCPIDHVAAATSDEGFFSSLWKVYTPRRACMFNEGPVIWLHFFSDLFIAVAYYSIPLALVWFVWKRKDLAFNWMFWMFAAFILACGTTHIFGIWDLWKPFYKVDGLVRLFTALISIATAILLWPLLPKALAIPSPAQLEEQVRNRTAELADTNDLLRKEIDARTRAENEREGLLEREKVARAEAEHANQMKDEFLATLSHELRTPLGSILGWAQLMRRGHLSDADVQSGLSTIERNARIQTQLIEDLLEMSRIVSGKVRLDVQPVDLLAVLEAAVVTVTPAIEAKGIRVEKIIDPQADALMGDPNRLQQVFWNLLSNAVKFTPKDGKIQILLSRVNSHVEVSISDTGEGIDRDFLPYVFDRFRQQDSSSSRKHSGLGLGLSIVKHLVELHGGRVRAHSEGVGRGASFLVELPMIAVHPRDDCVDRRHLLSESFPSNRDGSISLKGLKILVVEDEPDSRELVRKVLEQSDAIVRTAASGSEALDIMSSERFDLILSDIGMPEMDGYEFIRSVRALPVDRGGETQALALTAFARAEDRTRALRAGYQGHVAKPVDTNELMAMVERTARRNPSC